jgi:hypothetical protein
LIKEVEDVCTTYEEEACRQRILGIATVQFGPRLNVGDQAEVALRRLQPVDCGVATLERRCQRPVQNPPLPESIARHNSASS